MKATKLRLSGGLKKLHELKYGTIRFIILKHEGSVIAWRRRIDESGFGGLPFECR